MIYQTASAEMDLRIALYALARVPWLSVAHLNSRRARRRRLAAIPSPAAAFVFEHGKTFRGEWRFEFRQGAPHHCYGNAVVLAGESGLSYVEGFALAPSGSVIAHAWNAKADGTLVDSTWLNTGAAYFGVIFSVERGDDATWNADAHVLDDRPTNPIFTREWTGEDFTIQWPHSERLDIFRIKDPVERRACYQKWLEDQRTEARA
jgi:hypothetical protein